MEKTQIQTPPDESTIRSWVQKDIATAIAILNLIRNDPAFMKAVEDIVVQKVKVQEENRQRSPEINFERDNKPGGE